MKKWLLCAVVFLLAGLLTGLPFESADVGKLRPVKLLVSQMQDGEIMLTADTGDVGVGDTPEAALADMKRRAPGTLYMDTVEHLVVTDRKMTEDWMDLVRPACKVCCLTGTWEPEDLTEYLSAHPSPVSMGAVLGFGARVPTLYPEGWRENHGT